MLLEIPLRCCYAAWFCIHFVTAYILASKPPCEPMVQLRAPLLPNDTGFLGPCCATFGTHQNTTRLSFRQPRYVIENPTGLMGKGTPTPLTQVISCMGTMLKDILVRSPKRELSWHPYCYTQVISCMCTMLKDILVRSPKRELFLAAMVACLCRMPFCTRQ